MPDVHVCSYRQPHAVITSGLIKAFTSTAMPQGMNLMWMIPLHPRKQMPKLFEQTDRLQIICISQNLGVATAIQFVLFEEQNGAPMSHCLSLWVPGTHFPSLNQ